MGLPLEAVSEIDLNRLAQVFFETAGAEVKRLPMTSKPDIIEGLRGVFATLDIDTDAAESATEVQLIPTFGVMRR